MIDRFMSKVQKQPDGCWLWTAGQDGRGYGNFKVNGSMRRAHLLSYEHFVGEIPAGLTLDHLCRNRACVNPAHLEPVSHITNVMRGESPPARNARATQCKHGHPFTPENTYVRPNGFRTCRACNRDSVRRYAVTNSQEITP